MQRTSLRISSGMLDATTYFITQEMVFGDKHIVSRFAGGGDPAHPSCAETWPLEKPSMPRSIKKKSDFWRRAGIGLADDGAEVADGSVGNQFLTPLITHPRPPRWPWCIGATSTRLVFGEADNPDLLTADNGRTMRQFTMSSLPKRCRK